MFCSDTDRVTLETYLFFILDYKSRNKMYLLKDIQILEEFLTDRLKISVTKHHLLCHVEVFSIPTLKKFVCFWLSLLFWGF